MVDVVINVKRAIQISEALKSVEQNDTLDIKVSYWLGRLGDKCSAMVNQAQKEQNKLLRIYRKDTQGKPKEEVTEIMANYEVSIESLYEQEETIKVYPFKVDEFKAKEEIKRGDTIIKKDSVLVPLKFFTLMGDLISEN